MIKFLEMYCRSNEDKPVPMNELYAVNGDRNSKNHLLLRRNNFLRLRNLCLFIFARRFFKVLLIRVTVVLANLNSFSNNIEETEALWRREIVFIDFVVNGPLDPFIIIVEYGDTRDMKPLDQNDGTQDCEL